MGAENATPNVTETPREDYSPSTSSKPPGGVGTGSQERTHKLQPSDSELCKDQGT